MYGTSSNWHKPYVIRFSDFEALSDTYWPTPSKEWVRGRPGTKNETHLQQRHQELEKKLEEKEMQGFNVRSFLSLFQAFSKAR